MTMDHANVTGIDIKENSCRVDGHSINSLLNHVLLSPVVGKHWIFPLMQEKLWMIKNTLYTLEIMNSIEYSMPQQVDWNNPLSNAESFESRWKLKISPCQTSGESDLCRINQTYLQWIFACWYHFKSLFILLTIWWEKGLYPLKNILRSLMID